MGWGGSEGWGLHPYPRWLCFTSSPPRMTGTVFLPDPRPLGPHKTLPYLVKLYFLLICPLLLQFFLIKSISLIKIYLKLQINLSHQIKIIFSKNWIILFKCLTRQYHNKNKNLIIQNQWSIVYNFFFLIIKTKENVKIGALFPTLLEKKRDRKPCWVE